MVLRSATNSIRNKKWSEEDVEEVEYEGDSDGEDTDYGNSRVSFFPKFSLHIAEVCSFSHLVLTAGSFQRGEPRAKETRKGGRASARQTNGKLLISLLRSVIHSIAQIFILARNCNLL